MTKRSRSIREIDPTTPDGASLKAWMYPETAKRCDICHAAHVPIEFQAACNCSGRPSNPDMDDLKAAEWAIECKRRGYGYGPGSSTKAEDERYLRNLRARILATR